MYIIGNGGESDFSIIGYTEEYDKFIAFLDECKKCVNVIENSRVKNVNPFKAKINECKNEISKRERIIGELGILIKHNVDIWSNKKMCADLKKEISELKVKIQNYNNTAIEMNKPDLSKFSKAVIEFSDRYDYAIEIDDIWIEEIKEFEF